MRPWKRHLLILVIFQVVYDVTLAQSSNVKIFIVCIAIIKTFFKSLILYHLGASSTKGTASTSNFTSSNGTTGTTKAGVDGKGNFEKLMQDPNKLFTESL